MNGDQMNAMPDAVVKALYSWATYHRFFSILIWLINSHLKSMRDLKFAKGNKSTGNKLLSIYAFIITSWFHLKRHIPPSCSMEWSISHAVVLTGHSGSSRDNFINMTFNLFCFSGSFDVCCSRKEIFDVLVTDIDLLDWKRHVCYAWNSNKWS